MVASRPEPITWPKILGDHHGPGTEAGGWMTFDKPLNGILS